MAMDGASGSQATHVRELSGSRATHLDVMTDVIQASSGPPLMTDVMVTCGVVWVVWVRARGVVRMSMIQGEWNDAKTPPGRGGTPM